MNHYRALGLSPGAQVSDKDVRDAYFRLAKEYHPDSSTGKPDSVGKFRAAAEAYEVLRTEEKRVLLSRQLSEDVDVFKRGREARAPGYASNFHDADAEFQAAENAWKQQNKRAHKFMAAYERFVHPRVLFLLLPMTVLGYYCISTSFKKALQSSPDESKRTQPVRRNEVEAWHNPKTGQWETSAPWNVDYRNALAAGGTRLMKRRDVKESKR